MSPNSPKADPRRTDGKESNQQIAKQSKTGREAKELGELREDITLEIVELSKN